MPHRALSAASVVALLSAVACLGAGAVAAAEGPDVESSDLVDQVRRAELAFAATVAEKRPEAFAAMVDEHAVFLGSGGEISRGRAAITAAWLGLFAADAPEFVWHPEIVELSGDATVGLTRGPWTMRGRDENGEPIERTGTFTSIWRRQADGSWRVLFDAGCGSCPACD